MNALLLLSLMLAQAPESAAHPLAPSLPLLSPAEQKRAEDVVERFIQYDIGKLPGPAGKQALADFNKLGPEAFFVLVEGFNRAADLEASCPAVILGRKLATIVRASKDIELVRFAQENIGAGVTAKRHTVTTKNLQLACIVRRGELQRLGLTASPPPSPKAPSAMTLAELTTALEKRQGPGLKLILTEIDRRLQSQPPAALTAALRHDRAEVRAAAARAVGVRKLAYGAELIALLQDTDAAVRQDARQALVRLADGVDHGPAPDASFGDRENSVRLWRAWWQARTSP